MNNTPHILNYLRRSLARKLWQPLLFLAVSVFVLHSINAWQLLFPVSIPAGQSYRPYYRNSSYVTVTVSDLYYSGYDYFTNNQLRGHYYYTLSNNQMQIYLLQAHMGKEAPPTYDSLTFTGLLTENDSAVSMLILNLAQDLDWTAEGLAGITDAYMVDEVACYKPDTLILLGAALICQVIGLFLLLRSLLFLCFPKLSPVFLRLCHYGRPSQILADAQKQLAEECIIRTHDMALTPGYLIEFSGGTSAIVPMRAVLWAFHFGTLRFRKMSYTLHLVMETGDRYSFRNKKKEDLDTIMEQLTEHFPNFFIGYSEEHLQLVHHLLKERRSERLKKIFSKK